MQRFQKPVAGGRPCRSARATLFRSAQGRAVLSGGPHRAGVPQSPPPQTLLVNRFIIQSLSGFSPTVGPNRRLHAPPAVRAQPLPRPPLCTGEGARRLTGGAAAGRIAARQLIGPPVGPGIRWWGAWSGGYSPPQPSPALCVDVLVSLRRGRRATASHAPGPAAASRQGSRPRGAAFATAAPASPSHWARQIPARSPAPHSHAASAPSGRAGPAAATAHAAAASSSAPSGPRPARAPLGPPDPSRCGGCCWGGSVVLPDGSVGGGTATAGPGPGCGGSPGTHSRRFSPVFAAFCVWNMFTDSFDSDCLAAQRGKLKLTRKLRGRRRDAAGRV